MMNVWGRTATRDIVRFDRADNAAGVATVNANDHRNAEDVYLPASVGWNLDWIHKLSEVMFCRHAPAGKVGLKP